MYKMSYLKAVPNGNRLGHVFSEWIMFALRSLHLLAHAPGLRSQVPLGRRAEPRGAGGRHAPGAPRAGPDARTHAPRSDAASEVGTRC